MARNEGQNSEDNKEVLADVQNFLLADEPMAAAQKLSVEQLEAILAHKKAEAARERHRQLRSGKAKNEPTPTEVAKSLPPPAKPTRSTYESWINPPGSIAPDSQDNRSTNRFEPPSMLVSKSRKSPGKGSKALNVFGYLLETLVIVAALGLFANWGLQQFGISLDWFTPVSSSNNFLVAAARPEGVFLRANAEGVVFLPAMPTPKPTNTGPTPIIAGSPQAIAPTPTPIVGVGIPLAVAPTPTPAIVQSVVQSIEEGAPTPAPPPEPPRRLQIPKLGLDAPIREVTVNLGTWQVADYAVGYHHGTTVPGKVGNMVLAGHRDIRGSVFLKLNELQRGDEFRVFTDIASFRYIVTDITEVAPTETSVMLPTSDATATLITCTPIGLATRRLIIRAKLVN